LLHPEEVLTPERLLEHVWDEHADPFTNTVRVTISNLRRKLVSTSNDGQRARKPGAAMRRPSPKQVAAARGTSR